MDTNIYFKDRKIFMRIYQIYTRIISQVGGKSFNYIGTFVYERSKSWQTTSCSPTIYFLLVNQTAVLLRLIIYISWPVLQIKVANKLKSEIIGWDYGKILKGDWLQWDMGPFALFFLYSAAQNVNTRVELQEPFLGPQITWEIKPQDKDCKAER